MLTDIDAPLDTLENLTPAEMYVIPSHPSTSGRLLSCTLDTTQS